MLRCCRNWRVLSKGHPESRCSVHVRVHHSNTACDCSHCGLGLEERAAATGRKPLFGPFGFGVLPIRGVLYTLTHAAGPCLRFRRSTGSGERHIRYRTTFRLSRTRLGDATLQCGWPVSLRPWSASGLLCSTTFGGVLVQHWGPERHFYALAESAGSPLSCSGSQFRKPSLVRRGNIVKVNHHMQRKLLCNEHPEKENRATFNAHCSYLTALIWIICLASILCMLLRPRGDCGGLLGLWWGESSLSLPA